MDLSKIFSYTCIIFLVVTVQAQTPQTVEKGGSVDYIVTGTDNLTAAYSITLTPTSHILSGSTFSATIIEDAYKESTLSAENYVFSRTFQSGMTSSDNITKDYDVLESVTYYDGLGRTKQEVVIGASPTKQDIVAHIAYDGYGRTEREYLPYMDHGTRGTFRDNDPASLTRSYYLLNYEEDFLNLSKAEVNPFSHKEFDGSPLDRLERQAAPGKDWAMDNGNEIEFDYDVNGSDQVKLYNVTTFLSGNTYAPSLVDNGYYVDNSLYRNIIKDENHTVGTDHTTEEFTDQQGRTVMKRAYNGGEPHDTYYVYDDYGNLTYVIPPQVNTADGISATELEELCYKYTYDQRNRVVEKKVPGKEFESIVYNRLDQPVMTQDSNLRANGQWLFTKYDAHGRVAYTGSVNGGTPSSHQTAANAIATPWVVQAIATTSIGNTPVYYNNGGYPTSGIGELHTINYYDTYLDTDGLSVPATVLGQPKATNTKGLATVNKTRILNASSPADWITSITGYDHKGRAIYTAMRDDSYLGYTNTTETELDFGGKVIRTRSSHTRGTNAAIVTEDVFEYDHQGRLLSQKQQISDQAQVVLTDNTYDKLGQLARKKVGNNLQTVDYGYNVRGWLKSINDVENLRNDLFAYKINYNTKDRNDNNELGSLAVGGNALFNGNISEIFWATATINTGITNTPGSSYLIQKIKGYQFDYDPLNRLLEARFGCYQTSTAEDDVLNGGGRPYSLESVSYDKNGNITGLDRTNEYQAYQYMDHLTYHYSDQSNKLLAVDDSLIDQGPNGFYNGNTTGDDYAYDANGNMIMDLNKGIPLNAISYNHLNLPKQVTINNTEHIGNIQYIYDATGTKLRKIVTDTGESSVTTTDYAGNYIYENTGSGFQLQFFGHPEGYVSAENGNYKYVYEYKDHLGNIRLSYTDEDGDGDITVSSDPMETEIVEENNYYPFGLEHKGYNNVVNGTEHPYKFNGKEHEQDLGLNSYDYGARSYMPDLGRWKSIDPHADSYFSVTPYSSFANNPISFVDPTGKDILFWQWDSVDEQWSQVSYDKLGKESQEAIQNFLKTDSGKSFFASFANKGDKIGDVEFGETGEYANHNFNLQEGPIGGEGLTPNPGDHNREGPSQENGDGPSYIDFYVQINDKLSNPEVNGPETIGHEAFLHLSQYVDDYIKAFEENGSTGSKAVLDNYYKDNYKGYEDHFSMTNDKKGRARKYHEFINQLSKVLNPAAVQKHVDKERKKNYNTAKFHKKQSQ